MHRIQYYIACNKVTLIEQVKRLVLAISQAKLLVLFLRVITETSTSNFRVEHLVKRLINYFKAYNSRLDCSISNLWNNCSAGLRLTIDSAANQSNMHCFRCCNFLPHVPAEVLTASYVSYTSCQCHAYSQGCQGYSEKKTFEGNINNQSHKH